MRGAVLDSNLLKLLVFVSVLVASCADADPADVQRTPESEPESIAKPEAYEYFVSRTTEDTGNNFTACQFAGGTGLAVVEVLSVSDLGGGDCVTDFNNRARNERARDELEVRTVQWLGGPELGESFVLVKSNSSTFRTPEPGDFLLAGIVSDSDYNVAGVMIFAARPNIDTVASASFDLPTDPQALQALFAGGLEAELHCDNGVFHLPHDEYIRRSIFYDSCE